MHAGPPGHPHDPMSCGPLAGGVLPLPNETCEQANIRGQVHHQQQQYQAYQAGLSLRAPVYQPVATSTLPSLPTSDYRPSPTTQRRAARRAGSSVIRLMRMLLWLAVRFIAGPILAAVGGLAVALATLGIALAIAGSGNPVDAVYASPNQSNTWPAAIDVAAGIGIGSGLLYWGGLAAGWVAEGWRVLLTPFVLVVPTSGGMVLAYLHGWLFEAGAPPSDGVLAVFVLVIVVGATLASLVHMWDHTTDRWSRA